MYLGFAITTIFCSFLLYMVFEAPVEQLLRLVYNKTVNWKTSTSIEFIYFFHATKHRLRRRTIYWTVSKPIVHQWDVHLLEIACYVGYCTVFFCISALPTRQQHNFLKSKNPKIKFRSSCLSSHRLLRINYYYLRNKSKKYIFHKHK